MKSARLDYARQRHDKQELINAHWLSMKTEVRDQPLLLLHFSLSVQKVAGRKEAGEEREYTFKWP